MIHSDLLFHEITHLFLTGCAIGTPLYLFPKILKKKYRKYILVVFLGAFLGEFLLDADHLFDYFLAYGFQFQPGYFFGGDMFVRLGKTYIPFHAWEWVIILGFFAYRVKRIPFKYFLTAAFFGILFHMIYDMFFNHYYFLGYSLIYRIFHDFQIKDLVY